MQKKPTNTLQKKLAEIWYEILGCKDVGIHDSFFDLGAHSLSVIRLIICIKDMFNVDLDIKHICNISTISELSERIFACQDRFINEFAEPNNDKSKNDIVNDDILNYSDAKDD